MSGSAVSLRFYVCGPCGARLRDHGSFVAHHMAKHAADKVSVTYRVEGDADPEAVKRVELGTVDVVTAEGLAQLAGVRATERLRAGDASDDALKAVSTVLKELRQVEAARKKDGEDMSDEQRVEALPAWAATLEPELQRRLIHNLTQVYNQAAQEDRRSVGMTG